MLEGLSRIRARVTEIEQRISALDEQPVQPAPQTRVFSQALAEASRPRGTGPLPPAAVAGDVAGSEAALPPPPHWLQGASRSADYEAVVREAARRHGVDPSLAAAVARAESGFNPRAVSSTGAVGLMQLMPGTARSLGVDPFDPEQNADGGVRYLAEQIERFGDVRLALAAYNAGPSRVASCGDVPPIAETQAYVQRVLQYQQEEMGRTP